MDACLAGSVVRLEVMGSVTSVHHFGGIADFQYLPLGSSDAKRTPGSGSQDAAEPTGRREPLLCMPPIFSKLDSPIAYDYKQLVYHGECTGAYKAEQSDLDCVCVQLY